jgi:hypothetical protein
MAPKSQVHPMPMFERKVLPPIQNIHVASASPSVATTSTQNTIPELPFHAAGTGTGKAPPVQNLPRAPKKARDSKKQIVWKWVKGLFCGCLSTATCCMFCCGCCGSIPAPHVFYDENDPEFKDCSKEECTAMGFCVWPLLSLWNDMWLLLWLLWKHNTE